jgi:hypothetical protein
MTVIDDVVALISARPGLTECQIAESLFGRKGQQQRVNPVCRRLLREGRVERRGQGYSQDPFTYHQIAADAEPGQT